MALCLIAIYPERVAQPFQCVSHGAACVFAFVRRRHPQIQPGRIFHNTRFKVYSMEVYCVWAEVRYEALEVFTVKPKRPWPLFEEQSSELDSCINIVSPVGPSLWLRVSFHMPCSRKGSGMRTSQLFHGLENHSSPVERTEALWLFGQLIVSDA